MEKVKIQYLKNLSHYKINGGINFIKWKVDNAFFTIICFNNSLRIFHKKSDLKFISEGSQNYLLIAIGLFSYDFERLNVNSPSTIINSKGLGKFNLKDFYVNQISKPKKINWKIKQSCTNFSLKESRLKVKTIEP